MLPPYYVQGTLSIVREELVLNALSAELDNSAAKQIQLIQASMAQNVKDKREYYTSLYDKVLNFRHALEFNPKGHTGRYEGEEEIERLTNDTELNRMIHIMNQMAESGEMEELEKELQADIDEYKEENDKRVANPYLFDNPENPELQWQFGETQADIDADEKARLKEEHGIE